MWWITALCQRFAISRAKARGSCTVDPTIAQDRAAWDRAWRIATNRRVESPLTNNFAREWERFGAIVAATVSVVPPQYRESLGRTGESCPTCGKQTQESDRMLASMNLLFANSGRFGQIVWGDSSCFECCPVAGERAPIPW
jgi:hypothetical protein